MSVVLFNSKILNGARANLRTSSHIRDAVVDIGGYHFECGAREFSVWSRIVSAELNLGFAATKTGGTHLDLADVYFRMRERAFELAKDTEKSRSADADAISKSLVHFSKISRPAAQPSEAPPAAMKNPVVTLTPDPDNAKSTDNSKVEKWQLILWYRRAKNRLDESSGAELSFPHGTLEEAKKQGTFTKGSEREKFQAWYERNKDFYDERFGAGSADELLLGIIREGSNETGTSTSAKPPDTITVVSGQSSLDKLLADLHSYIGLAAVKRDIEELANSIRVDRARRAQGLRVADRSLHMVFYGNP
ncbi:MAG TPA: hypothetical protein VLV89_11825, partial [Candidatus Acidoferrum sp.]|nr:hypothetical protein [Candidatus Acidoferrum sp.]